MAIFESFNGKLRDELLSGDNFTTLLEANVLIENWRCGYNHIRPHTVNWVIVIRTTSDQHNDIYTTIYAKTNGAIPIYYRVILKGGVWRVYDVVIEGVSLISNYRSQFREILMNKPPEYLLETLRKKVVKS